MEHNNVIVLTKEEYSVTWTAIGLAIGFILGYAIARHQD
jgi:hypothetical protein